jgi:hypothetical protein
VNDATDVSSERLINMSRRLTDVFFADDHRVSLENVGRSYFIECTGTIALAPAHPNLTRDDIVRGIVRGGAIFVEALPARTILRYRPGVVAGPALTAAKCFLRAFPHRPVVVHELGEPNADLIFAGPVAASAWLVASRGAQAVTRRGLKLDDPSADRRIPILLQQWRTTGGRFDPGFVSFLMQNKMFDRAAINVERKSDRTLMSEHVGLGLYGAGWLHEWSEKAATRPVGEFPDEHYGAWIERRARMAMDQNRPFFDCIDAVLGPRHPEPYHTHYNRLLLPMRSADGTRRTLTFSYRVNQSAAVAA